MIGASADDNMTKRFGSHIKIQSQNPDPETLFQSPTKLASSTMCLNDADEEDPPAASFFLDQLSSRTLHDVSASQIQCEVSIFSTQEKNTIHVTREVDASTFCVRCKKKNLFITILIFAVFASIVAGFLAHKLSPRPPKVEIAEVHISTSDSSSLQPLEDLFQISGASHGSIPKLTLAASLKLKVTIRVENENYFSATSFEGDVGVYLRRSRNDWIKIGTSRDNKAIRYPAQSLKYVEMPLVVDTSVTMAMPELLEMAGHIEIITYSLLKLERQAFFLRGYDVVTKCRSNFALSLGAVAPARESWSVGLSGTGRLFEEVPTFTIRGATQSCETQLVV